MLAGTGDGLPLTRALLERGWRLRLSMVTAAAARVYPSHPRLELQIGALGAAQAGDPVTAAAAALAEQLTAARQQGDPFEAVVDATHPFAQRISRALELGCRQAAVPLLRLERPQEPLAGATVLEHLSQLKHQGERGERLLLALGARQLGEAVAAAPWAVAHARILPMAEALRRARAAGLSDERLACLRPSRDGAIEAALLRQWQINVVLCRQSGGSSEALWHRLCRSGGQRLLLLQRPADTSTVERGPLPWLLERLGSP